MSLKSGSASFAVKAAAWSRPYRKLKRKLTNIKRKRRIKINSTYTKHPSKRWYLVTGIIALILVIVLCAACGSNAQTSGEATPPPASTESVESTTSASDGELRGDFKEAMDSYEDFMNDYADFMKKYKSNPSDVSLLADYADYMTKLPTWSINLTNGKVKI